jgi:prevent-host-death family protein
MEVIEMKTLSLSEAKMKLSGLVDLVNSTDEEVIITKNGRPAAVLVSPEEFEGWKETIAIRSDKALMKEIKAGLRELKKGKARVYTLEELFS